MTKAEGARVAVICEDDAVAATALVDTLSGLFGFSVAAVVATGAEALAAAGALTPELVVIDLALAGERGLGIISALVEASPATTVVALIPARFAALRADAREAGARELVELGDLRPLRRCLERLHAAAHGANCPTCPAARPPGTAAASDHSRSRLNIDGGVGVVRRAAAGTSGTSSLPPKRP